MVDVKRAVKYAKAWIDSYFGGRSGPWPTTFQSCGWIGTIPCWYIIHHIRCPN